MLKIGLTGGIGSGKTTISKIFELLQVPVYYADDAAKQLYQNNQSLITSIKKNFGEGIYEGSTINRAKLAEIVFNDPEKLKVLNQLVHPLTIADAAEWMEKQTASYVIKEAALIFEGGAAAGLDYIIGVYTPVHLRIKRVMDRDGLTRDQVLARMARQIDEELKMKLCDFQIRNDEQQLVIPQVLSLHQRLTELSHQ